MKKKTKIKYHYIKPKNDKELQEQTKNIDKAFDILFNEISKGGKK